MPRNYTRKMPDKSVVTEEQLEAAKKLISEGASKRKAASQVGLKESTLRKRLKVGSTATSMGRFTNTFSKAQEASAVTDIYQTTNSEILPITEDVSVSNQVQPQPMQETEASHSSGPHAGPNTVTSASIVSLQDRATESRSTSPSILSQDDLISPPVPVPLAVVTVDKSVAPANMSVPSTSKEYIPLSFIQELPKAKTQNRRKKGKKSIIATESPYKLELKERKKKEEEALAMKKIRLDLKERLKSKMTCKRSTKTEKKTVKVKKNKENDEQEYFCPLCGEKYICPPDEDWIQCSVCKSWWHEQCSNFDKGIFTCDNCAKW